MILEIITQLNFKVKVICSLGINEYLRGPKQKHLRGLLYWVQIPHACLLEAAGCWAVPLCLTLVCGLGCHPVQENPALPDL